MATATAKPDQADVLSELTGMKALLEPTKLSLQDLISQHASLSGDKTRLDGEVAKLTGDKTKLVAGATIPTDLISAANTIAALTKERDDLKAERDSLKGNAMTVDEAAAKKIVTLGFVSTEKKSDSDAAAKAKSLTDRVLEAQGCKTLAESEEKYRAKVAANPGM
ncbi:MAG: hypothetical protein KGL39_27155 [Patescibacteria group bacterium]|nr:hypothetical protein [Patescibacteria group bacterium]